MRNPIERLEKLYAKVELALILIAGLIVMLMMIMVTADVLMRNLFNRPIEGVYELVTLLFVSAVFMGLSFVQFAKENVKIDAPTEKLPIAVKEILEWFGYLIGAVIAFIIFWKSGQEAYRSFVTQDYTYGSAKLLNWPSKTVAALGMLFLGIRLLLDMALTASKWMTRKSRPETAEAETKLLEG